MRWLIALALALGAAAQSDPFADNLRRLDEGSGDSPDTPIPEDEGPDGPDSDGACSDAIEAGLSGDFDEITLYISTSATAICAVPACHEWLESFVSSNIDRVEAIVSSRQTVTQEGTDDPDSDPFEKYVAVKQVLKSHPFSGINRKVQLKPTAWASAPRSSIIPSPTQDDERMGRLEGRQRPQTDRGPGSKGATPSASPWWR